MKHNWKGNFFNQQCHNCGERSTAPFNYCDSENVTEYLYKLRLRNDCPAIYYNEWYNDTQFQIEDIMVGLK